MDVQEILYGAMEKKRYIMVENISIKKTEIRKVMKWISRQKFHLTDRIA